MSDQSAFEGRCTCGGIRFRMNAKPMIVHACHCTECQRLSGGAFAINALIESEQVELLASTPEPVPVDGTSGKPQTILRCPRCKVALWSHYPGGGPKICFIVGTPDDPESKPGHPHTSTRLPGWTAAVHGRVDGFYDLEVWPAKSLEVFGGEGGFSSFDQRSRRSGRRSRSAGCSRPGAAARAACRWTA